MTAPNMSVDELHEASKRGDLAAVSEEAAAVYRDTRPSSWRQSTATWRRKRTQAASSSFTKAKLSNRDEKWQN